MQKMKKVCRMPMLRIRDVYPGSLICSTLECIQTPLANHFPTRSGADPDPGSGAFLTPGSGIRNRFFPDPGSQPHTFESSMTVFWVKSSIIL
jgi:hypothetical protein